MLNQVQHDKIPRHFKNANTNITKNSLTCHSALDAESTKMKGNIHQYYVYILSNMKNGTLYIGMTNDLERRMFEHKNKLVEGFTKKYDLQRLVYFECFQYVNDAIKREKQLKNWHRQWKIDLIQEENPDWNYLAHDWFD